MEKLYASAVEYAIHSDGRDDAEAWSFPGTLAPALLNKAFFFFAAAFKAAVAAAVDELCWRLEFAPLIVEAFLSAE